MRQDGTVGMNPAQPALNPRQESFARLMAVGTLSLIEAYRQAGYSEKGGSKAAKTLALLPSVASRIATLKRELHPTIEAKHLVTRDKLIGWLMDLAGKAKGELARLKAIELLAKMQGYNEPAAVQHSHVHVQVDAGLMEQLKVGHAALLEKQQAALPPPQGDTPRPEASPSREKGTTPAPLEGEVKNIYTAEIQPTPEKYTQPESRPENTDFHYPVH